MGFLETKAKSIFPHPSPGLHSSPVLICLTTYPAFLLTCKLLPARSHKILTPYLAGLAQLRDVWVTLINTEVAFSLACTNTGKT